MNPGFPWNSQCLDKPLFNMQTEDKFLTNIHIVVKDNTNMLPCSGVVIIWYYLENSSHLSGK